MSSFDECSFVLKTSVRFFRNVSGIPFVSKFTAEDAQDINDNVRMVCDSLWGEEKYDALNINTADKCDILSWCDNNCCNVRTEKTACSRMAFSSGDGCACIVTNESEHILVQALMDGFNMDKCYSRACDTVNALSRRIPFAAKEEVGFVTANPACVGTGLKAGVLVHLPALSFTPELGRVSEKLNKMGANIKGFYTEGKKTYGAMFQIANIYTLGIDEEETLEGVKAAAEYAIAAEAESRAALIGTNRRFVYDNVWRSLGAMALAWKMDMKEFMVNLSNIRLGAELGIIDIDTELTGDLFRFGQQGYINRYMQQNEMTNENIDYVRARIMRETLSPVLKRNM